MRRAWAVLVAVLVAVCALGSCALPTDSKPRTIDADQVADLNPSTTAVSDTLPDPGAPSIRLYLFRDNTLVAVERKSNKGRDINSVLAQLLTGPTEEERALGFTTFIPPQTKLLRVQITTDRTLIVDLSAEMDTVGGSTSKAAYAQLVFTATSLSDVARVQFRTDGNPVSVPTDNGNVPIASRKSYTTPYVVGGNAATTTLAGPAPAMPTTVP